jgi:uncharacterized protein YqfA (UPF0365 family)
MTNYHNIDLQFPHSGVFDLGGKTFLGAVCRSLTPSLVLRWSTELPLKNTGDWPPSPDGT